METLEQRLHYFCNNLYRHYVGFCRTYPQFFHSYSTKVARFADILLIVAETQFLSHYLAFLPFYYNKTH